VFDVATALGVMAGVDPADAATKASEGKFERDYTRHLQRGALKNARIGIARDFMGKDGGTDRIVEDAVATLTRLGAVVVDVKYPDYILQSKQGLYNLIVSSEFKAQIEEYLKTAEPRYPHSLAEILARANDPSTAYRSPEKAVALKYTASIALELADPIYLAAKREALAATRAAMVALFDKYRLDAIVYPTSPRPATPILPGATPPPSDSPTSLANESGFPDLIVPAGMTPQGLPVTISFFGRAFSEGTLLGYGYDFEQATKALTLPKYTPALATDRLALTTDGSARQR
jgi:amidase